MRHRGSKVVSSAVTLALCLCLGGCAALQGGKEKQKDVVELTRKDTSIEVEGCRVNAKSAQKLDANGDGRPEIVRVMIKGREVCRVVDLNLDGKIDRTSYFSESGRIRRVESDFDRDGVIDEIALFSEGIPTEKRSATTMDGRIDTWDYFTKGKLTRSERDQNGDGVVDQWWEYPRPECPLVHIDQDGDGRPDPGASVDYCKATGETVGPVVSRRSPPPTPSAEPPTRSDPPGDDEASGSKPAEKANEAESTKTKEAGSLPSQEDAPPAEKQPGDRP